MAESVEFDYAIGDKVIIEENGVEGLVKEQWIGDDGIRKYLIRFVRRDDGISTAWRKAWEIKAVT